ncbi:hypothetical protein DL96DRAFT_1758726 [Flagelloscypha sp. PMI_526]|nr:hypothetical protein DL96DRAFT_1758726 [Flagelloscypha sp. PMI_526]
MTSGLIGTQRWNLLLTAFLPLVAAGTKYLDDSDTSAWSFSGSWNVISPSNPCPKCAAQGQGGGFVDPSKAYDGTYHDASTSAASPKGGTITFKGNAIQVYGIQFDFGGAISFSLQGTSGGRYEPPLHSAINYNFLMFEAKGLSETDDHVLTFSLEVASTGGTATLLDYAIITFTDVIANMTSSSSQVIATSFSATTTSTALTAGTSEPSQTSISTPVASIQTSIQLPATTNPSAVSTLNNTSVTAVPAAPTITAVEASNHKPPIATIVGGVIAGVAALVICALLLLLLKRRRKASVRTSQDPYPNMGKVP